MNLLNRKCFYDSARPLYFLHIPKTAGTSVKVWLQSNLETPKEHYCKITDIKVLENKPLEEIERYKIYAGHFGFELEKKLGRSVQAFTFLREPVATTVSSFRYQVANFPNLIKQARSYNNKELENHYLRIQKLNLVEFLKDGSFNGYIDNNQVRYLSGQYPYHTEYLKCDDAMLEKAKQNLKRLDVFGVVDSMQLSIDLVALCYGLNLSEFKIRVNQTKDIQSSISSPPELTEEELELLNAGTFYDRKLYDFAKDLFLRRINRFLFGFGFGRRKLRTFEDLLLAESEVHKWLFSRSRFLPQWYVNRLLAL